MKKKNTYRRRPNNTDTVVKLSGNRRKPYAAKITAGYDPISGLQLQKPIGYFETREEALEALTLQKALDKETLSTLGGSTYDQIMAMKNKSLPTFADLSAHKNPASVRYDVFNPLMKKMEMDRLPYDTRHTFATLAKLHKVDKFCRKRIMGHKASNLTDDVYTHTIYN